MFADYFFHYLAVALVGIMVLGALALPIIHFSNRQDQKIAAGDVKAAAKKAWAATGFLALFVVAGIVDLIRRESLSMTLSHWSMVFFCAYKSHETWSVARRLCVAVHDEPSLIRGRD